MVPIPGKVAIEEELTFPAALRSGWAEPNLRTEVANPGGCEVAEESSKMGFGTFLAPPQVLGAPALVEAVGGPCESSPVPLVVP
jgi:hypothetical protein